MPYPDCNKTDALFFSVNCSFFQKACCQSEKMFLKSMQPCRKFLKSYSGWSLSVNSDAAAGNPLALVPAISQRHAAAIRPHRNFSAAPFSPGLGSSIFSQPEPEPPPASLPLLFFFHEPAARKPDSTAPVQRKIPHQALSCRCPASACEKDFVILFYRLRLANRQAYPLAEVTTDRRIPFEQPCCAWIAAFAPESL